MIAILERTQSNVQQNIEQLQIPTMGVTIAFYWYQIFALAKFDSQEQLADELYVIW